MLKNFKKFHKKKIHKTKTQERKINKTKLILGNVGLQAMESGYLTDSHIQAVRNISFRYTGKEAFF